MNRLSTSALARRLRCDASVLTRLSLCFAPDSDTEFRSSVERIAGHCGADAKKLAELLREVDAVRTMRGESSAEVRTSGLLLAARERKSKPKRRRGKRH